jgi:hypothetical protein
LISSPIAFAQTIHVPTEGIKLTDNMTGLENGFHDPGLGSGPEDGLRPRNAILAQLPEEEYEALAKCISDLHMPGAGDGLTVVSAMRHANASESGCRK